MTSSSHECDAALDSDSDSDDDSLSKLYTPNFLRSSKQRRDAETPSFTDLKRPIKAATTPTAAETAEENQEKCR
jgi:hypothetical protein